MQDVIDGLERKTVSGLVEFEFDVASLVAQKSGWEIQRESRRAYRFVEMLGEDIRLEMVAIPAGTFTMGSPEDEPERYRNEEPPYEVMLKSFFMGRYPVTQAQWFFVAGLEQVNRELE
ncbi:MAG: SUMF1/EgtB/PvdO family nonheme iron enzyme, partial [Bacteroidota bacterium]